MSQPTDQPERRSDESPPRPPRLSPAAGITVAVLLLIPCVALALVPVYSHETPTILGWPFFYWYQLIWVVITPILTYAAYVIIKRSRGQK